MLILYYTTLVKNNRNFCYTFSNMSDGSRKSIGGGGGGSKIGDLVPICSGMLGVGFLFREPGPLPRPP